VFIFSFLKAVHSDHTTGGAAEPAAELPNSLTEK
jgi:hypothetical protein